MKKTLSLLCALGSALVLWTGCASSSSDSTSEQTETESGSNVTAITLNQTSITTSAEQNFALTASLTPSTSQETVTWTTSDNSIARLSASEGASIRVSTVSDGTATVTASAGGRSAFCTVKVKSTAGGSSTTLWRADEYETVTEAWASNTSLGIMTVMAKSGSKATLEERAATVDDYSFSKAFSSGGGGSTTSNALKFSLSGGTDITVYAAAAGSSGSRNLMLKIGDNDAESLGTTTTTATAYKKSYAEAVAVDCYLYSSTSSINIYAVKLESEGTGTETIVYPTGISLDQTELALERTDDNPSPTESLVATITNAGEVTAGYDTVAWSSSNTAVATVSDGVVTAVGAGSATITASTVNGYTATCAVTVTSGLATYYISASDRPTGYASITPPTDAGTTVTTKSQLVSALASGGLIYVSGTIDVSDGCLPSTAGGTTDKLDDFVAANSSYSTYEAFQTAYAAGCSSSTDDGSSSSPESSLGSVLWTLNKAYGNKIKLSPVSNTTIIGLEGAVIKGGTFQISGVSNVTIRNLTIRDAYDPFPHHEENDGFNAQWDNISVNSSAKNIWIDHCTLEDTMKYKTVTIKGGSEKWQTYDGLCDITKSSKNVVVSYCLFQNHDKTMLIGSGSSDLKGGYITIHHNRFLNCGQRLPMTTYPYMHIYNNSYERDDIAYYSQQACIVGRYGAYTIVAENNYFGSGVKKCLTKSTSAAGSCYASGNVFAESAVSSGLVTSESTKPFTPSYTYELDTASSSMLTATVGAGVWSVRQ